MTPEGGDGAPYKVCPAEGAGADGYSYATSAGDGQVSANCGGGGVLAST